MPALAARLFAQHGLQAAARMLRALADELDSLRFY
jgi:hypothetical protein